MNDRDEIRDLLARAIYAIDRNRPEELADCLTEDFTYGVTQEDGSELTWIYGRSEMLTRCFAVVDNVIAAQHVCTNLLVDVSDDTATATTNHIGYVVVPQDDDGPRRVVTIGGRWYGDLVRTGDGWRFTRLVYDPVFIDPYQDDLRAFPPRGEMMQAPEPTAGGSR